MKEKNYTQLTTKSGRFVRALDYLQDTENTFIVALTDMYGDEIASDLYNQDKEIFDNVRRKIADYLSISITDDLGTTDDR